MTDKMIMLRRHFPTLAAAVLAVIGLVPSTAAGQTAGPPAAVSMEESAALSLGWTHMLNQKYAEALEVAQNATTQFPRSVSVLALGVESLVALRGALPALDFYQRWQGGSPAEQPAVLRRVARAVLYQWAFQTGETGARLEALKALRLEGEEAALSALLARALEGSLQDIAALAAVGHEQALDRIVERMEAIAGSKLPEIDMLSASRNARAVPALSRVLKDPLAENRMAAARALGELGGGAARNALVEALNDAHGGVRLEAAGALLKLKDTTGLPLLLELAESESESARRSAAWLLAADPNDRWQRLVRSLAVSRDPVVRLDAATLLAPHDPGYARTLFDQLRTDSNPAIRDATEEALAMLPSTDFATLRQLLRSTNGATAVAAGARLMALTR